MTEPSGILIIHKHTGVTSHDIVGKVRRLYGTRRVGHTGTLDPLASGVLVVLVGRAAKAAEYLVADRKEYLATLRLGLVTDTEDVTGTILSQADRLPDEDRVRAVCREFVGEILQVPPMYSALKVEGQKLCDLARKGVTVERKPRPVTIFDLVCQPCDREGDYRLAVHCSSGTYIRTLCADIGAALGCGGVMATLERRQAGGFRMEDAHTVPELEAMSEEERLGCLIPIERLFDSLPAVRLPEFFEKLCRGGCELYQKKLGTRFAVGDRVRLCSSNGSFFALGEVREYENGSAIKSLKLFDLTM
ncbi:MAG: tRNA pseudouridine(55) synthase TruB [Clostridia bacterium]|nr:tRNA pseudouridine(55) synthase TruB [Clostridia bacterium]